MIYQVSLVVAVSVLISTLLLRLYISPVLPHIQEDLTNRVFVITGGGSGIGQKIAQILHTHNATIILGCRNVSKCQFSIGRENSAEIYYYELDLTSFKSVRAFASEISKHHKTINYLFNNAGVRQNYLQLSNDNIETQYQVNYLSHYLLTKLLLPLLLSGHLKGIIPSRIIHVSSSAHSFGVIDKSAYDVAIKNIDETLFKLAHSSRIEGVYGDTKLMQVLFSYMLQHKISENATLSTLFNYNNEFIFSHNQTNLLNITMRGIKSISVHPGFVDSNMGHADTRWMQKIIVLLRPFLSRSTYQGGQAVICAALLPNLKGGEYLDNCKPVPPSLPSLVDTYHSAVSVHDTQELGDWLWDTSERLVESL